MEESLIKFQRSLKLFEDAYITLEKALSEPSVNEYIKDSIVKRFEYTLEMAWKTLKTYLSEVDAIDESSPKKVIRAAFEQGYIGENIEFWDEAFEARNKTAHEYGADRGETAYQFAKDHHFIFKDLLDVLKKSKPL